MTTTFYCYRSQYMAGYIYYGHSEQMGPGGAIYEGPGCRTAIAAYLARLWAKGVFPAIAPEAIDVIESLPE